jgi:hypothetical protein
LRSLRESRHDARHGVLVALGRQNPAAWVLLLALLALAFAPPAAAYSITVPDFGKLERELRIRPSQKAQFDSAVQASQRALMSVALAGLTVKETLAREFAKPFPDLNVIYRAHEEVLDLTLPNFRDGRRRMGAPLPHARSLAGGPSEALPARAPRPIRAGVEIDNRGQTPIKLIAQFPAGKYPINLIGV